MLTLSVMRRLLPAGLAWFVAAWWVVLPINFNTLYQVHLFGAIPVLVSWLILLSKEDSRWRRGMALAVVAGSSILVRNELAAYGCLFACALVVSEFVKWRKGERFSVTRTLKPYVLPLAVVALLVSGFYARSIVRYPSVEGLMRYRHTNNVGQIFAYGFQQRYPGAWVKDCWTDYGELMTRYFGAPELTMTEAFVRNPAAMTEHLSWNASLIPSGLQLMLFNRMSGTMTPDYIKPITDVAQASWLSALVILCLVAGLTKSCLQRAETVASIKKHRWILIAMACYAIEAVIVMVMQRPRTSYVFPLGIEIMGLVAYCLWRLFDSKQIASTAQACSFVAMALTILIVPAYYPAQKDQRLLLRYLDFTKPLAFVIRYDHEGKIMVPDFASELAHYMYGADVSLERRFCFSNNIAELKTAHGNELAVLEKHNIRDVLLDQPTHEPSEPVRVALASSPQWHLIALRKLPDRTLSFYSRTPYCGGN